MARVYGPTPWHQPTAEEVLAKLSDDELASLKAQLADALEGAPALAEELAAKPASQPHAVHFSTGKDDWETPPELYAGLDSQFHFTLDACANSDNAKCTHYLTEAQDGLATSWTGQVVWCNPPYSQLAKWLAKAAAEAAQGVTVVMLIPSRTDTIAWHDYAMKGCQRRYIRGRLRFVGAPSSAPFPSAVLIMGPGWSGECSITRDGQPYG